MKKILPILLISCSLVHSKPATLDLTNLDRDGLTWSGIFDGGFHPWWRGNGEFKCHQSDVDITITNSGRELHLTTGDIQFNLIENYTLTLVSFYGRQNLSLKEAEARIDNLVEVFQDIKVIKGELYLLDDGYNYNFFAEDRNTGAILDKYVIGYSFSSSGDEEKPFVERFSVSLKSSARRKLGMRVGGKLQPPAGYEHLSLDPYVVNKAYYDDLKEKAKIYNSPEAELERERQEKLKNEMVQEAMKNDDLANESKEQVKKSESNITKLVWLAGIFLLGMIALFIRKSIINRGRGEFDTML